MRSEHEPVREPRWSRKGAATRARIVESAAELVLTRGVRGTTLDDIGTAARVGRSQLYHYFADKDELVRDVIARQVDNVVAHQGPDYDDLTSWDAWHRWRDRIVAGVEAGACVGGCPLGSLGTEVAERDPAARALVAAGFDRWERGFREGIRTMRDRGLIGPEADPGALAAGVLVALQGGLLLAQVRRDVRSLEVALDAAVAAIRQHATNTTTVS